MTLRDIIVAVSKLRLRTQLQNGDKNSANVSDTNVEFARLLRITAGDNTSINNAPRSYPATGTRNCTQLGTEGGWDKENKIQSKKTEILPGSCAYNLIRQHI